jgi:chromosome partitioning protein
MIIAIAGAGGHGPNPLACNLAVLRARTGRRLCIVDLGARHHCSQWCADRGAAGLVPWVATRHIAGRDLKHDLRLLTRQFNDVLVNLESLDTRQARYALAVAGQVVLPVDPRGLDLASQYGLMAALAAARDFNPALRTLLVPLCTEPGNGEEELATMRAFATRMTAATLAATAIATHPRHDYGAGRCVCDAHTCDPAQAARMQALYGEVYGHVQPGDMALEHA